MAQCAIDSIGTSENMFSKASHKTPAVATTSPGSAAPTDPGTSWDSRLQEALGNDAELLALANEEESVDQTLLYV